MRARTSELLRYTAASAAALAVDVGVLAVLVSGAGLPYLPASAISFAAGGIFLYFLCIHFVFRYRRVSSSMLELPLFLAFGLAGLAVNCAVMYVTVNQFHENYLAAKAVAAGCTFAVNFGLRRFGLFSRPARPRRRLAVAD